MKKAKKTVADKHEGKGLLNLAGEALSVLGEEIIEGKDKLVEAASEKFTSLKKSIKKLTTKKATPKKKAVEKKVIKKIAPKKVAKKVVAKKAVLKKAVAGKKK